MSIQMSPGREKLRSSELQKTKNVPIVVGSRGAQLMDAGFINFLPGTVHEMRGEIRVTEGMCFYIFLYVFICLMCMKPKWYFVPGTHVVTNISMGYKEEEF